MDLSKLQNGSDVRGVALAGVENEPVTLDDAAVRAIAGGFAPSSETAEVISKAPMP